MAKLAKDANVISHWHYPIENFQTSTMEFYAAVEQALKPHEIPDYSVSRIDWREGGVLTARREYLRIKRGKLAFDICAAPFGTGFFFSSWLAELPPSHLILWLLALFVGWLAVIGICVEMFGQSGFFPGIFAYLGLIWLLGYLIREERLGTEAEDLVLAIPFLGGLYQKLFQPPTYYRIDTTLMYQAVVHKTVTDVVDQLLLAKGTRALTELERKPTMREFYQR
ncbi:MAG: hypothetical protein ACLQM6_11805 [Acidobacteriaceae bacterium]